MFGAPGWQAIFPSTLCPSSLYLDKTGVTEVSCNVRECIVSARLRAALVQDWLKTSGADPGGWRTWGSNLLAPICWGRHWGRPWGPTLAPIRWSPRGRPWLQFAGGPCGVVRRGTQKCWRVSWVTHEGMHSSSTAVALSSCVWRSHFLNSAAACLSDQLACACSNRKSEEEEITTFANTGKCQNRCGHIPSIQGHQDYTIWEQSPTSIEVRAPGRRACEAAPPNHQGSTTHTTGYLSNQSWYTPQQRDTAIGVSD